MKKEYEEGEIKITIDLDKCTGAGECAVRKIRGRQRQDPAFHPWHRCCPDRPDRRAAPNRQQDAPTGRAG